MLLKLTDSFSLCVLAQQADVEVTEMCPVSLLNFLMVIMLKDPIFLLYNKSAKLGILALGDILGM